MPIELDSIGIENIQNYFRKVRHYMFAYLQGCSGGNELEKQVKKMKKIINLTVMSVKITEPFCIIKNIALLH